MVNQDGSISIKEFTKGIGISPYEGFARIQNLDVFETPGIAKIGYRTTSYGFTPASLPTCADKDSSGNVYVGCEGGHVYKVVGTTATLIHSGSGVVSDVKVWQSYLFITCDTTIQVYGPLNSASAQIFGNWQTGLTSGAGKVMLSAITDAILYVCNGNSIGSISSFVAGAVGVAPTGTWQPSALILPSGYYARCLALLGKWLVIGTQRDAQFSTLDQRGAAIIPWDKTSATVSLTGTVFLQENGINQMISYGNKLYIHAGVKGNIYVTDLTNFQLLKKLPFTTRHAFGSTIFPYPNAITLRNGNLLIGTSTNLDSYPNESVHGVYELNLADEGAPIQVRNVVSSGGYGTDRAIKIGVLLPISPDATLIGWQDGTTYGLDTQDSNKYTTAFFESGLHTVGTSKSPKSYQHMRVVLGKPLVTGQSIVLKYRKNLTADWTTIATLTSTTSTDVDSSTKALITDAKQLQIRVELNQSLVGPTVANNIELKAIEIE